MIQEDKIRDKQARDEDIKFWRDQNSDRLMVIGGGLDKDYAAKRAREDALCQAREERKKAQNDRVEKELKRKEDTFNGDAYSYLDGEVPDSEGIPDEAFIPKLKGYSMKTTDVNLTINIADLIKKTSLVCNRFNISISAQTALLSSVLNCGGVDLDSVVFSRAMVNQLRTNSIEEDGVELRMCITEKLKRTSSSASL